MSHRLPPLNSVRAFEATARHLSFTRAASELCVTRGAVAQQVSNLEAALDIQLFWRRRNRLSLTPEGERYLPHITNAFRMITAATEEIAPALKGRVLRLGVAPDLIGSASELGRLLRSPPAGLRLRLVKTEDLDELHSDTADALLRSSDGPCPTFHVEEVSLEKFGLATKSAKLVTQPGLAACSELRALVALLRG